MKENASKAKKNWKHFTSSKPAIWMLLKDVLWRTTTKSKGKHGQYLNKMTKKPESNNKKPSWNDRAKSLPLNNNPEYHGLNSSMKRQIDRSKNRTHFSVANRKHKSPTNTCRNWKWKDGKEYFRLIERKNELVKSSYQITCTTIMRNIKRDEEGHCIMIKRYIQQEESQ